MSKCVYVFGDQSSPVLDKLDGLLRIKDNALLASFLNEAFLIISRETRSLPSADRVSVAQSESPSLLIEAVRRGTTHATLESSFLCIYEIGYYIDSLSRSQRQHPPPCPSLVLGICTGAIAAASVSCSVNVFEISRLGLQAVTVAFRTGFHVGKRAELLGYPTASSWSMIVSLDDENLVTQVLERISADEGLPATSRPYISAVGTGCTTISGPPAILESLRSLDAFSGKKLYPAPIYGPYHCSSEFTDSDLGGILEDVLRGIQFLDNKSLVPLVSCFSGEAEEDSRFGALLEKVVKSALVEQVRMDRVAESLLRFGSGGDTTIIPINTQAAWGLANRLSQQGASTRIAGTSEDLEKNESTAHSFYPTVAPGDERKIAIVGFSGRFPEADDLEEFWDLLARGRDVHKPVPEERFSRDHYDPTGQRKNTSQVQYGCWLKSPGYFDTQFFHLSPKEAMQTDPMQRLALLTAYEALEMGGIVPDRSPSTKRHRVGVFYGASSTDWGEVNSSQDVDTYYIPGANRAFIPGRVNYFFKFSGPSIAVDTACSSSLAATNIAITALVNGECDTAVAGGTNVLTNPDNFAGLDRGHFLSRTGNCKPFDDSADGYCRADGVGTLILKRLPDAVADKDPIFGVILGALTNHSAESVSITRPLANAQEYLFKQLLANTGIRPHDVSYVEMHGTGTQAGDAVEMSSVLSSFAPDYSRPQDKSLYLGTVKANIGHSEAASGVLSVIKVLLMMQKNRIPPHCGIKSNINHSFPTDLDLRGVKIALDDEVEWPRPADGRRRVLVNNFSAAGGNSSILLEDGPADTRVGCDHDQVTDLREEHIVVVSARSNKALEENLRALKAFIANPPPPGGDLLSQLSYTTTARRIHHNRRMAFVASNLKDLQGCLSAAVEVAAEVKAVPAVLPKVGFLFTGQGVQESGMAKAYFQNFSSFRSDIHEFDSIAKAQGFPSVLPLVEGKISVEDLSAVVVQLGTCIIQMALSRFWINLGIRPQYVVGHSLGEFAALQVSGVLSINDTIYLCGQRASLLEETCTANTHGMVAVRATAEALREYLPGTLVEVSCINDIQDTVLSGSNADIVSFCDKIKEKGFKYHRLEVPFAFHSSQVDPALDKLEKLASHVEFCGPAVPMVSTLLSKVITTGGVVGPQYIRRHCRETVNFLGAIREAQAEGLMSQGGMCIEIGTHPILTRMVNSIVGQGLQCYASLRRKENIFKTLASSLSSIHLAGLPVVWDEYHRDFPSSHKSLTLPRYSWQLANHWIQYKNWCLNKGDDPLPGTGSADYSVKEEKTRLSDAVHEIIQKDFGDKKSSIVMQSDMNDPTLRKVMQQHVVVGLAMSPSTFYADVAFTLASYMIENHGGDIATYLPCVNNMLLERPLLFDEHAECQFFRASMDIDWESMSGTMRLYKVDSDGEETALQATCDVSIEDPKTNAEIWKSRLYLVERSISQLTQGPSNGSTHVMGSGMLYKLFSAAVEYGPDFHGIRKVWFDSRALEATADVIVAPTGGNFVLDSFCLDSVGHLSGFIMNCADSLDLDGNVYINHGWRSLTLVETLQCNVHYQCHVKMHPVGSDDSMYVGDVYILRDGKIIGVFSGLTFQKYVRKVLEMIMPNRSASKPKSTHPNIGASASRSNAQQHTVTGLESYKKGRPAASPSSSNPLLQKALKIVADEIGVEHTQLADSAVLTELGVDSLMSLTILGTFREELYIDIASPDFYGCATVRDLKDLVNGILGITDESTPNSSSDSDYKASLTTPTTDYSNPSSPDAMHEEEFLVSPRVPPSGSSVLQGTVHCPKTLFLFPDGSGSATSYRDLPHIAHDLRVIGLDSPYLKSPKDFTCGIHDITDSYLDEIRRRQPQGPYYFGGWSAGGVSAFDAAWRLAREGEVVERLVLIDSPNPTGQAVIPKSMYDFLQKQGLFGSPEAGSSAEPPEWLYQHFDACVKALHRYDPRPFEQESPKTTMIWARDGVCKSPDMPRPEAGPGDSHAMDWLLENRNDFGPNGWERLINVKNINTISIEDANHFSLVRQPAASRLCPIISEALELDPAQ
ncbi:hypothetical protein GMORB2_1860 [Geosmithia morbida]|uniref:Polyketide synthase n=1 Tax=Geosmithia morbida TaxID=1094350 RepID=A0A9P4YTK0_9HYPO|nr:uncharacterized protein GMORB2_1860 [Geosmithia morbida]KAF4121453.1 hypothetical protein GMORB2_1860 [Geosmithia morbida]